MNENTKEKIDYQKTLNLPQTEFSMRAGLVQKEPICIQKWEEEDLYKKIREDAKGRDVFVLHDGPPYANGHIHIGHALNKLLKDFIIKFKTMEGFDALYIPGWDCHGLPIEHQLLKELKKRKSDVDCVDFREKAHKYAMKYVDIQREEFKRLGIFGEWDEPYLTLDTKYEYWILKSLAKLNSKGYIYRGLKPVNWCSKCETALAEAEVEYDDHISPSIFVEFNVTNKAEIASDLGDKPLKLIIWTTTPWTLMANVAVAVHPNFEYCLVDTGDKVLVVEESLQESVLAKADISGAKVVKKVKGKDLTSLTYDHPFGILEECKVVTADYVTKEDGTGLVHTAPGHGQDDFETGKRNNLEVLVPVNDRGVYTDKAGKYEGQHVFKANPLIIEDLSAQGVLLGQENLSHSYPHCWRCKNPIIFRATKQWFLKVDHEGLREKLQTTIKNDVQFVPPSGEERILSMVTGRPDWCLSRQRYWGVPIPAIECVSCGDRQLNTEVVEQFAEIVKDEGTNAWFKREVNDFIPKGITCNSCGKNEFKKTDDILDVWFDSGVSHQSVVKERMGCELPIDLYLEGSDQHRGWFQSSLIPAVAMEGKAPYKAILTHGFVVDGDGRKMSKSLGNVIKPQDILKQNGADILRLWVASSSYSEDIRMSKENLARVGDAYRKVRNTIRYLIGNLAGFDPDANMLKYDDLLDLDKWALGRLKKTIDQALVYFNEYEFAKVYKEIYTFCNEDLSSFYLDILKDRLYTSATHSIERRSAQVALYHMLNHLVRVMAPILSFSSEEIFAMMPKDASMKNVQSVHLLKFLDLPGEWLNKEVEEKFRLLESLRPHVLKALEDKRRDGDIGSSLQARLTFRSSSKRDLEYLNGHKDMLPSVFIVSQVNVQEVDDVANGLDEEFAKTEIVIDVADGEKCVRCWNYSVNLGSDPAHATLCLRCTKIVKEIT